MNYEWRYVPIDGGTNHWRMEPFGTGSTFACVCGRAMRYQLCINRHDGERITSHYYPSLEAAKADALTRLTAAMVGAE